MKLVNVTDYHGYPRYPTQEWTPARVHQSFKVSDVVSLHVECHPYSYVILTSSNCAGQ